MVFRMGDLSRATYRYTADEGNQTRFAVAPVVGREVIGNVVVSGRRKRY
jgi:hypothetical protein